MQKIIQYHHAGDNKNNCRYKIHSHLQKPKLKAKEEDPDVVRTGHAATEYL